MPHPLAHAQHLGVAGACELSADRADSNSLARYAQGARRLGLLGRRMSSVLFRTANRQILSPSQLVFAERSTQGWGQTFRHWPRAPAEGLGLSSFHDCATTDLRALASHAGLLPSQHGESDIA